MQLSYLCEFAELAKCRSYAVAADNLFLSESSLSRHIKKLEEEIGVPLFHRSTRKVELTEFGSELLPCASRAVELRDELTAIAAKHRRADKELLTISAIDTFDRYLPYDEWLPAFQKKNPGIVLEISAPTAPAGKLLQNSPSTVCFVPELMGCEDPNLKRLTVCSDRMTAVISAMHPLANKERISFPDIKNEQLVFLRNNSPMFEVCMKACEKYGFRPSVRITADGRYIKDLVRQGFGIGILLNYASMRSMDENLVYRTFDPPVSVNLNLVYSKDASSAVQRFISYIKHYLAETREG